MLSKLLAVLGVGLLVSATAAASHRTGSRVTITSTSVTATWKESYAKGSVKFSGTQTVAGTIEASLRNVKTGRLLYAKRFSVGTGTFTNSLPLTARPVPGTYRLRLKEFPTGNASDRNVIIPAPPEGVIDVAYMTSSKNGRRMKVIRNAKIIYAHFHFLTRPQTEHSHLQVAEAREPQGPVHRLRDEALRDHGQHIRVREEDGRRFLSRRPAEQGQVVLHRARAGQDREASGHPRHLVR